MCATILSAERDYPVIGLTCRAGSTSPALSVERVRSIVGAEVPIFVIEPSMVRKLREHLPRKLLVRGGAARVWHPGVLDTDPLDHPLIDDPTGVYGGDALDRLADEFRLPLIAGVDLPPEQQAILHARQRARAEQRNGELEAQLRQTERDRDQWQRRALAAEHTSGPAEPTAEQPPVEPTPEPDDPALAFSILVLRAWGETLTTREDRADSPLASYTLSAAFVRSLERERELPLERIAWVCAMVACGKAAGLSGLEPHPLTNGAGGRQITRDDGSKGWRCKIGNYSGGPRVHYFIDPSGRIDFADFGLHDLTDR